MAGAEETRSILLTLQRDDSAPLEVHFVGHQDGGPLVPTPGAGQVLESLAGADEAVPVIN